MGVMRKFIVLASGILFITGLVKLISASGDARILGRGDQLLPLSHRQVFFSVGLVELAISGYLFFGRSVTMQLAALAWLMTNFAAYRIVLWTWGDSRECGCLGNALDWWPWLMKHQDVVMKSILVFLATGAYGFLWRTWRDSCTSVPLQRSGTEAQEKT